MYDTDALVIGAGPAGASAAILLAQAGWRVTVVEQHEYPRQKVCGECIAAGNLKLLDELGVGTEFRQRAGQDLNMIGWMGSDSILSANMPACGEGSSRYGRALGRDTFDLLLLNQARAMDVRVLQPAKVQSVRGTLGRFLCTIVKSATATVHSIRAAIIIDAHGSWENPPHFGDGSRPSGAKPLLRPSDLFAFKATFSNSGLSPMFLPVLSLRGGYGGMVIADQGRTTLAYCIRRDMLHQQRACRRGVSAGIALEHHLIESCRGVRDALRDAKRCSPWLSVGPLRPGVRVRGSCGVFRVGNAAGETHPLIGEGISMALQSTKLLTSVLRQYSIAKLDERGAAQVQSRYEQAWKHAFTARLRLAAIYAHVAMRPALAVPARRLLSRWPALFTQAARLAGKAQQPIDWPLSNEETA